MANLGYLTVGERASIEGGTALGIKLSAKDARFAAVNASFEELDISGLGEFQNGNLTAAKISGNDLIFRNGVKAALDEIILNGNEKHIFVGMSGDAIGNTTLSVGILDLRQGSLRVGNIGVAPATAAISQFANGSSQGNIINGNVAVGPLMAGCSSARGIWTGHLSILRMQKPSWGLPSQCAWQLAWGWLFPVTQAHCPLPTR